MPAPNGVKPRKRDEQMFNAAMRKAYLIPFFKGLSRRLARAGNYNTIAWVGIIRDYVSQWERQQNASFPVGTVEAWAFSLDTYHRTAFIRDFKRAFTVDITPMLNSAQIQPILRNSINESVRLIKTIPGNLVKRITPKLIKAEAQSPLDLQARERIYRTEGQSTGYNLRRITRDQSNKLTGRLTEARQTMAGIDEYVWETSEDDRVRPNHASKQGQIYRWDQAPSDTGHPGSDIQCRCVAIPAGVAIEQLRRRAGQ